jgi:stage V sporulation protein S
MATTGAEEQFIRVRAGSSPEKIAGAITMFVQAGTAPTLRAVGATAVNQMVKACAKARGNIAPTGRDLVFVPGFTNVPDREDPTKEITCLTMRVVVQ